MREGERNRGLSHPKGRRTSIAPQLHSPTLGGGGNVIKERIMKRRNCRKMARQEWREKVSIGNGGWEEQDL